MPSKTSLKNLKASLNDSKHKAGKEQRSRKVSRKNEYTIGIGGDAGNLYKFTGKQTRRWRELDTNLHNYLVNLTDSGVKSVSSKPGFRKNEDVQLLLQRLKTRLKAKLKHMRAPPMKHADYTQNKIQMTELASEIKQLNDYEAVLDREIRKEERLIEQLEDSELGQEIDTELTIQVPNEELNLPKLPPGIR